MNKYDPKKIEKKWQEYWEKNKSFEVKEDKKKPKYYVLDMFPYPSGSGLHVGHPKGYIATDVIARAKMMQGYNVLHPMGWDAFGLPAENYAIENKTHPAEAVEKNVKVFKKQLGLLGFTYDWDREVNTTDPDYYKWTQWTFLQMFKKGLAYESNEPINWCPSCQTGLANEDLEDGKCERCGSAIERKPMRQWMLKITDYADRMLEDLEKLPQWEDSIKEMQKNWIGKSNGASVIFNVIPTQSGSRGAKEDFQLEVFTTRPDTLFGATYMVVAPEHDLIKNCESASSADGLRIKNYDEVNKYVEQSKKKSDLERAELQKEKTGVELKGIKAINSVNGEEIPIWVADYVLSSYGTGAIMAVPAHDERDNEFAKKFKLPIKEVVVKKFGERKKNAVRRDGVFGVVKNKKGEVLILLHKETGIYRLPGGGREEGEDNQKALQRELKEETNYGDFKIQDYLGMIEANYKAVHKGEKRHRYSEGYSLTLNSAKKSDLKGDSNKYELLWLSCEEALKCFTKNKESWGEEEFVERAFNKKEICFSGEGVNINSDFIDGLETTEAKEKMIEWLEEKGLGKKEVNFKLRDWVFSRQRYWGEPIPLVYCEKCKNKKQKVLIIHGFKATGEGDWLPWVKNKLEDEGCEVFTPTMSTSEHPELDKWMKELMPYIEQMGEDDIVIGHSLGSKAILHLLEKANKKIGHVYLVASAIGEMNKRDWDYFKKIWPDSDINALQKFWETPVNFSKITKLSDDINVILSDDDPYIQEKTHQKLPKEWKLKLYSGFGHFIDEKIPELLKVFLQSKNTGWIPVPEDELPLKLPDVKNYEPSGTGESPLANIDEWVNTTCPKCSGPAKRETNTMPQWAGSSWYYLRYIDPDNDKKLVDKKKEKYFSPVDLYVGGAEHATRHLIYARFWHKFLYDIGVVNYEEPFIRLQHVGLILAEDGRKMSKRWNNVINPDDVVEKFGADAMRLYEMFMGPFNQAIAWDANGLVGMRRFLERVWALQDRVSKDYKVDCSKGKAEEARDNLMHLIIRHVGEDINLMKFNTAISYLMLWSNSLKIKDKITIEEYRNLILLLSPFAPHLCEELWSKFGDKEELAYKSWPEFDSVKARDRTTELVVQVNGKVRAKMSITSDTELDESGVKSSALKHPQVQKWLKGKEPKKVIYVKGKLISIVV